MYLNEVDQLLRPEYLDIETGYKMLNNGQLYLALLTQMPSCKSKWVDWWYRAVLVQNNYDETKTKKTSLGLYEQSSRQHAQDAKHYSKHMASAKFLNLRLVLYEASEYFDMEKIEKSGVSAVICGRTLLPDDRISGHVIHVLRDTEYGCIIRSRYWFNDCHLEQGPGRLNAYIADMGYLAENLRKFIQEIKRIQNKPDINCKFCYSDEVVKNGVRKGTQYWLCRNCGRGFVNNMGMPKMKYSMDTITKAVHDYLTDKSLSGVRKDIEKESNLLPSKSTIYGWVRKMNEIISDDINIRKK